MDAHTATLRLPVRLRRRGIETRLVPGHRGVAGTVDRKLIETVARAHDWFGRLSSGVTATINDLAVRDKQHPSDVTRILPIAFVAPDIVETILQGKQPVELAAEKLLRCRLPTGREQQRQRPGFV